MQSSDIISIGWAYSIMIIEKNQVWRPTPWSLPAEELVFGMPELLVASLDVPFGREDASGCERGFAPLEGSTAAFCFFTVIACCPPDKQHNVEETLRHLRKDRKEGMWKRSSGEDTQQIAKNARLSMSSSLTHFLVAATIPRKASLCFQLRQAVRYWKLPTYLAGLSFFCKFGWV
jgi:hypothetical protein